MKEKDVFEAILGKGVKQGVLTVDEINDALPVGSFSLDRLEYLMELLDELGVRVVDYGECRN
ncbi:MAG: RNA polymerase sigma factor region1.1 domain-containing protein [Nitrospirae bacterium]|nr:RNA polymerase sigma factor region1.1 domain-containing protein [Nitrospirota bacterium]MCL5423214.1 RNA polymerase sigma factor region1.1 domain-containing protein [Nitrospirota bacterium]